MTLEEFLKELEKTPRNWQIRGHWLRLPSGDGDCGYPYHCPISAVLQNASYFRAPVTGGTILGLTVTTAANIVTAADTITAGTTQDTLKQKLLAACGLLTKVESQEEYEKRRALDIAKRLNNERLEKESKVAPDSPDDGIIVKDYIPRTDT